MSCSVQILLKLSEETWRNNYSRLMNLPQSNFSKWFESAIELEQLQFFEGSYWSSVFIGGVGGSFVLEKISMSVIVY